MELELKAKRSPSPLRVARTVLWSFFGVRNSEKHAEDTVNLTWPQIIFAGITGGALGLAVLASLAAFHTSHLLAQGEVLGHALNGGYQLAFALGAVCAGVAALLGTLMLKIPAAQPSGATSDPVF